MATENKAYYKAMLGLRRSSAASPVATKASRARRGLVKGGRPKQHQLRSMT